MERKSTSRLRFRWGIASVFTLSMVLVIAVLIGTITILDIRRERTVYREGLERRGRLVASALNDVLANYLYFAQIDALRDVAEVLTFEPDIISYVQIFSPEGRLLIGPDRDEYPSGVSHDESVLNMSRDPEARLRFIGDSLEVNSPITAGTEVVGLVRFGFDGKPLASEINDIIVQHIWQGLVLAFVGALIVYVVARYVAMPIRSLAAVATRMGGGDLDRPVVERGTAEIATLGNAFERMRLELRTVYSGLEKQVSERTQQLASTNQELKTEIAERERAEEELLLARDHALEASQAKSSFVANISHEIRTPMNAIVGMADALSETPLDSEQKEYVGVFKTAGETLLTLIDNVLDLAKVEAGQVELERLEFDLEELLEATCQFLAVRAHEKGIELNFHILSGVPTALVGDPVRLRQVVTNLVGNAIKFTERGEVVLKVEGCLRPSDPGSLLFTVSDVGVGIPPDKLGSIFESFTQADPSTTRRYGGTGLGLAISRRLAELIGGGIWAESAVGQGSTFYFTARFGTWPGPKRDPTPFPAS